jgi:hypothetical protein
LRPHWLRKFPQTSALPVLENYWTKRIWQQAAADPSAVARRTVGARDEMEAADEHVYEIQQLNRKAFAESGLKATWEVEPWVDLSNQPESERIGWDGDRIAAWRVDNSMTWWRIAARGASGRVPLHRTLHDWFGPWVRTDLITRQRESWNRFWYSEVDGARTPRNWIMSMMPWAQILTRVGGGNPRDVQHAAYLYDADLFFTADRRYAASLEHLRPWSPARFARTVTLVATNPIVDGIERELDRAEMSEDGRPGTN